MYGYSILTGFRVSDFFLCLEGGGYETQRKFIRLNCIGLLCHVPIECIASQRSESVECAFLFQVGLDPGLILVRDSGQFLQKVSKQTH